MGIKVLGPLLFWTVMFAIGTLVKYLSFKNNAVWFEMAPEATLWATGVLFSIAVSDMAFSQAKILPKYKRKPTGIGFEIDYEVTLPDSFEPTAHSKYLYLFLLGLGAWIFNIFISGAIINKASVQNAPSFDFTFLLLLLLSVVIASTIVFIALRALKEVSK